MRDGITKLDERPSGNGIWGPKGQKWGIRGQRVRNILEDKDSWKEKFYEF